MSQSTADDNDVCIIGDRCRTMLPLPSPIWVFADDDFFVEVEKIMNGQR